MRFQLSLLTAALVSLSECVPLSTQDSPSERPTLAVLVEADSIMPSNSEYTKFAQTDFINFDEVAKQASDQANSLIDSLPLFAEIKTSQEDYIKFAQTGFLEFTTIPGWAADQAQEATENNQPSTLAEIKPSQEDYINFAQTGFLEFTTIPGWAADLAQEATENNQPSTLAQIVSDASFIPFHEIEERAS
jgi:hypothetical protein